MKRYRPLLYIALIMVLAYFPVISFTFALKNDFFTQYFPQRFFIGEALRHGYFPLWNPYINYGIPVYADMNAGFWYPLTWLNALVSGYNAYSFTLEAFFHLLVSAFGMYWLTGLWKLKTPVRIIAAVSYACSGFHVGQLQHYNWITAAAWLPWCTRAMLDYYLTPSIKKIVAAILVFTLFITGSHPGMIIGGIYFFGMVTIAFFLEMKKEDGKVLWYAPLGKINAKALWYTPLVLATMILLAVSGMAWCYWELIPLFTRATPIEPGEILINAVDRHSFLSLLLPLTSATSSFDIALQNLYVGLAIFISAIAGVFMLKRIRTKYFLFIAVCFLFLASNLPGVGFLAEHLPLLGYVRLNSEFRIFGMLALIVFGAQALDQLYQRSAGLQTIFLIPGLISLVILLFRFDVLLPLSNEIREIDNKPGIRDFIRDLSFSKAFAIQSIFLILFCTGLYLALLKKKSWFMFFAVLDLVVATLLHLPFTGTGIRSTKDVQQLIAVSPGGFPTPSLASENSYIVSYPETDKVIGNWSMYSKKIGVKDWYPYPILLRGSEHYFEGDHPKLYESGTAFIFSPSGPANIRIIDFNPGLIRFEINLNQDATVVIKQNLYPGWETQVDGKSIHPDTAYTAFPAISLTKGPHMVAHEFRKPLVKILMLIYAVVFLLMLVYTIIASNTFSRNRS
jgi:hypothetical protein